MQTSNTDECISNIISNDYPSLKPPIHCYNQLIITIQLIG
jgi:hypothetical protein